MYPLVGERIRLRLQGEEPVPARVDLRVGRRCEVTFPRGGVHSSAVSPGASCELWLSRSDAAYLHRGSVLEETGAGRTVLLLNEAVPQRLQRREYFRLKVRMPMLLRFPGGESDAPAGPDNAGGPTPRWLLFALRDLSGGGCLCLDPEESVTLGQVHEARLKTGEGEPPIPLLARALRRTSVRGVSAVGFEFVDLPEKDRARIMGALFREYRRIRSRSAR